MKNNIHINGLKKPIDKENEICGLIRAEMYYLVLYLSIDDITGCNTSLFTLDEVLHTPHLHCLIISH